MTSNAEKMLVGEKVMDEEKLHRRRSQRPGRISVGKEAKGWEEALEKDMDNSVLEMLTPNVGLTYILLPYFSISEECAITILEHDLSLDLMMVQAR
ncbi:hypothetical protein ACH5RR_008394 [Cinchona calisaya]|uniref:Uncharacterized protein n=1 Tax=Cinchona calisaya TaxID=153742 RepID=A0ABD3AE62_9GENT